MSRPTLQINLSAGDINYAELTVPALSEAHRSSSAEIVAVIDCCRAQRTRLFDPDITLPEPQFTQRVERIVDIAHRLKRDGYIDRIFQLTPGHEIIGYLRRKYLNNHVNGTHDFRGCGLMSYFAGIEIISTRFVTHYDADMLVYQDSGFDWADDAIERLTLHPKTFVAYPRDSPPLPQDPPSETLTDGGWRSFWFNTQCFLIDRYMLSSMLPLIAGRTYLQHLVFTYIQRSTPKSPELLFRRRMERTGFYSLKSDTRRAWSLHPLDKSGDFVRLLPRVIESVKAGRVPASQPGRINMDLPAWVEYLDNKSSDARFDSLHDPWRRPDGVGR